ncbi:MAG: flagellar assembly protein FliW [Alphaproteobacteria bacterium]|nr:flagellar assembly protein FliW [Alphaproteobacteria bacterium]MDD9919480.1 flagellar assembly protein FliW [Alphaproteobacteria bacterium]
MMLNPTNITPADASRTLVYSTRFGDVHLREDRLISFPDGLFGFTDCTVFGLSRLPNADESPLLLLQCVNDPEVSFMVADPAVLGLTIKEEDRRQALKDRKMPAEDTQMMVILTMYEHGDGYYVTANLRAPLLLDSTKRIGRQHILANKEYNTQHKI